MVNRRRAPDSSISRNKKLLGHSNEDIYARFIGGQVIKGTQKKDVEDTHGYFHSVKSGKKWQVFLYGYDRISKSKYLKILKPSLEAFPLEIDFYFRDRTICIEYKEKYLKKFGKQKTKLLTNEELRQILGKNIYMESKENLAKSTQKISESLNCSRFRRNFLSEALFNLKEVSFLAIKDTTYKKDGIYKVFSRDDVLDVLTSKLKPATSNAGHVSVDYNVANQKNLLVYEKSPNIFKNIVELEVRNDEKHYRKLRFNMYSADTLFLLLQKYESMPQKAIHKKVTAFGASVDLL